MTKKKPIQARTIKNVNFNYSGTVQKGKVFSVTPILLSSDHQMTAKDSKGRAFSFSEVEIVSELKVWGCDVWLKEYHTRKQRVIVSANGPTRAAKLLGTGLHGFKENFQLVTDPYEEFLGKLNPDKVMRRNSNMPSQAFTEYPQVPYFDQLA